LSNREVKDTALFGPQLFNGALRNGRNLSGFARWGRGGLLGDGSPGKVSE
jgi:hypothetical protein